MNISQYLDLDFLKAISKDAKALQELSNEDNGFIFKRFQQVNILPDKKIVESIKSPAAINFLFNNYQITDENYMKYSSFFKDDSLIMNKSYKKNIISKEAIINILFDENKGFTKPGFLLTKNDFILYQDLICKTYLPSEKYIYLKESFISLTPDDIKQIPLSIFSKHIDLYKYSSHYLFDEPKHLENYKNSTKDNSLTDLNTLLQYVRRVDDISILKKINDEDMIKRKIREIYFVFKNRNIDFTINDIFPYVNSKAKIEIIKDDYTGDFNPQILVDTYLNEAEKLQRDFGYNFCQDLKKLNLPPIFRHYLSLIDCLENNNTQLKKENIQKFITLLQDDDKINKIELFKIGNAELMFQTFYYNLKNREKSENSYSDLIEQAITIYYNRVFEYNNSTVRGISLDTHNIVCEKANVSLNKFIWLSKIDSEYHKIDLLTKGIKDIPLEFQSDLILLSNGKPVKLDSPLFKADCVLKLKEINGVSYLNKNHINILSEDTIINFIKNGALIEDNVWNENQNMFLSSGFKLTSWQSLYLNKNYKNTSLISDKIIQNIIKTHEDAGVIFDNSDVSNSNNIILSELLSVCAEKIEFIKNSEQTYVMFKDDMDVYDDSLLGIEKRIEKFNKNYQGFSKTIKQNVIKLIKPNNFIEAVVFSEITDNEQILYNYIDSIRKVNESKRDINFNIVSNVMLENLIKPDFWHNQDIEMKKDIFIHAANNLQEGDFFHILKLIDLNNPKDSEEKYLKDYIISNCSEKLLYSSSMLNKVWEYNMEDLSHIFKSVDKNNKWNFKSSRGTCFSDYVEKAISNSSKDMFFDVLNRTKDESPAVYTMLSSPLAIINRISFIYDDFLYNDFNIFKKEYFLKHPEEQFCTDCFGKPEEKRLSPYLYIYDFLDLDVIAQGINSIRQNFSKNISNNYTPDLTYNALSMDASCAVQMFPHLSYIYNDTIDNTYKPYVSHDKFKSLIDNLIQLDVANVNIVDIFPPLVSIYGEDNFSELILNNMLTVKSINNIILREVSSSYYENENKNYKLSLLFNKDRSQSPNSLYINVFEDFAKLKPENSLFLSHLVGEKKDFYDNFKNINNLKGDFELLGYFSQSKFGKNIHNFSANYYQTSETYKEITKKINETTTISDEVITRVETFKL